MRNGGEFDESELEVDEKETERSRPRVGIEIGFVGDLLPDIVM